MTSTFIPNASDETIDIDPNNSYSLGVAGLKVNSAQSSTDEDGKIQLGTYSIELDTTSFVIKQSSVEVFRITSDGNLTVLGTGPDSELAAEIDGGTY